MRLRRARPLLLALTLPLPLGACHRDASPTNATRDPVDCSLALVEAARSPTGIPPALVDEALIEQLRRVQLVRRQLLDTHDPAALQKTLDGEAGPDRQYPVAERARKQRERAARGIQAQLGGTCRGTLDPTARDCRIAYLADPISGVPASVVQAVDDARKVLANAVAVKIECERGAIEALLVEHDAKWRVVDLFRAGFQNVEVSPNEPTMK